MTRLSDSSHWNAVHAGPETTGSTSKGKGAKSVLKRLFGPALTERMRDYGDHLLWNVHFKRHLPDLQGGKVIEVGSAPGVFIADFAEILGATPYGVEYSETGARVNRDLFAARGVNPENLIHADFFSDAFREQHRETFDAVLSRGFIEHFTDMEDVIDRHMSLLKPGGTLIVSIPNLRGFNGILLRLFFKQLLPLHNLKIMRKNAFASLFARPDLEHAFCGYYGTFNAHLVYPRAGSRRAFLLRALHRLQPLFNVSFRLLFGDRGFETAWFSPGLLFIGRKSLGKKPDTPG